MPRYRINAPKVIHQIFETEVVVVNLETGSYYSVEGAGIDLWRLLEAYRGDDQTFAHENARKFLDELAAEALIVPNEQFTAPAPGELPPLTRDLSLDPPRLRKFTDMRDLLLLDPIHELDEAGWPQRAQA
ncbi:MAG: PqqD family protein [Verrucomicrobiota bacterium]|nr:PqqD family protein [Verrucomicrobiota bacterium]